MRTAVLLISVLLAVVLVAVILVPVLDDYITPELSTMMPGDYMDANENMMDALGSNGGMLPGATGDSVSVQERLGREGLIQAFGEMEVLCDQALLSDSVKECYYLVGISTLDAGEYTQALSMFEALDGYKESKAYIEKCNAAMQRSELTEQLKFANTGDFIAFGSYEQDNNFQNGSEQIIWKVIGREGNRILVISLYGLDCQRYHDTFKSVTWQTCTLRQWLNEAFFNTAFTQQEQSMIPTVTVTPDRNQVYNTNSGNATEDKIFLLSIAEANKYMPLDEYRRCWPTDYAVAQGAWVSTEGDCWWWLRTPGDTQADAAGVFGRGGIHEGGNDVDNDENAIRPAMWIELEP